MLRCLYCDLDGTLLGPGASLLRDAEGAFTLLGVRALEACFRAGIEVVLVSGRRRASIAEDARLLGQRDYVFEAGAGLVLSGELEWLTGGLAPHDGKTISDQIEEGGAPGLLLEHYAGRLEYHEPWHTGREVSHLFRGLVDAVAADTLLRDHGMGDVRLVDNGVVHRRSAALAHLSQVRAYHLVPAATSKAASVARHRRVRGLAAEECLAVGDSREDLGIAPGVGTFWLVANAVEKDPTIREALREHPNARVADGRHGEGVYEAVLTSLAESR